MRKMGEDGGRRDDGEGRKRGGKLEKMEGGGTMEREGETKKNKGRWRNKGGVERDGEKKAMEKNVKSQRRKIQYSEGERRLKMG